MDLIKIAEEAFNRLITWERAKKANYGLELTLFDALNIQLDYFTEHRTNILMDRASIPAPVMPSASAARYIGMWSMA